VEAEVKANLSRISTMADPNHPPGTPMTLCNMRELTASCTAFAFFTLMLLVAPARSAGLESLDGVNEVLLQVAGAAAAQGCKALKEQELITAAQFTANQSTKLRFVTFEDFWAKALATRELNPTPLQAELWIFVSGATIGNACAVNVDVRLVRAVEGGHYYDGMPIKGKATYQFVWSDSVLLYAPLTQIESYTEHAIDDLIKRVVNLWTASQSR
jgi:hypothetical protein